MKESIDNFNKKSNDYLDIFDNKISTLNDKIFKIKDTIKNNKILTNVEKNELQNKMEIINKEKKELQENIEEITYQKNSINNEYRKSVDIIKKYKESKKYEDNLKTMEIIKKLEEDLESSHKSIDVITNIYTDNLEKMKKMEEDFENAYKTIILTKNKYDPNGFDIYGNHKDTGNKYDPNGFDRDSYNVDGLDRNGLNRNDIKRTKKNQAKLKLAMQNLLKIKKEKDKLIYLFFLSKLNINSSKELISNIEQLINNLYKNEQITNQVYNILNKAITYKDDS